MHLNHKWYTDDNKTILLNNDFWHFKECHVLEPQVEINLQCY